jgi:hypothetical protein
VILDEILPRWGVETVFVDGSDLDHWREALSLPAKAVAPSHRMFHLRKPGRFGDGSPNGYGRFGALDLSQGFDRMSHQRMVSSMGRRLPNGDWSPIPCGPRVALAHDVFST